jgi:hypothetical protein
MDDLFGIYFHSGVFYACTRTLLICLRISLSLSLSLSLCKDRAKAIEIQEINDFICYDFI